MVGVRVKDQWRRQYSCFRMKSSVTIATDSRKKTMKKLQII